jgi:hypothetical protein
VAELRQKAAKEFKNEKQVKAAGLELLKRLLIVKLCLPGRLTSWSLARQTAVFNEGTEWDVPKC